MVEGAPALTCRGPGIAFLPSKKDMLTGYSRMSICLSLSRRISVSQVCSMMLALATRAGERNLEVR